MLYNDCVMKVGIYFNKNYLPDNLKLIGRIKEKLASFGISCSAVCSPDAPR